jgi:murein DD-endopeptidase MepM/ murein hydrolase activator NlpD
VAAQGRQKRTGFRPAPAGQGLTLAFFLIFAPVPLFAEEDFPLIAALDSRDTLFRQLLADVELSRRRIFNRERTGERPENTAASLTVYRYVPKAGEDLFDIAARVNIPYASLATLNRFAHPSAMTGTLLLPSAPGIFIPEEPKTGLERLVSSARDQFKETEAIQLTIARGGPGGVFYFFPGDDFSPTERIFFLNPGFHYPLRNFTLSSVYGPRRNPVTGIQGIHKGLDLAADEGSEVFAAGDGIVTEIGEDPVYGKYVIIKHGETWASLYGHLSKIETALRNEVQSGNLIGRVGSTGQSTGPHLHFELRRNGRAEDPGKFLFQGISR